MRTEMGERSGRTTLRPLADPDAYLTGLSIGVHSAGTCSVSSAIVLVYYYKRVPNANAKGSHISPDSASMVLVAAAINSGIVPGTVKSRRLVRGCPNRQHTRTRPGNEWCRRMCHPAGSLPRLGAHNWLCRKSRSRMALSFILTMAMLGVIPFLPDVAAALSVIGIIDHRVAVASHPPVRRRRSERNISASARTLNHITYYALMMIGHRIFSLPPCTGS